MTHPAEQPRYGPDIVKKLRRNESDQWVLLGLEFGPRNFLLLSYKGPGPRDVWMYLGKKREVRLEDILRVQSSRTERSALGGVLERAGVVTTDWPVYAWPKSHGFVHCGFGQPTGFRTFHKGGTFQGGNLQEGVFLDCVFPVWTFQVGLGPLFVCLAEMPGFWAGILGVLGRTVFLTALSLRDGERPTKRAKSSAEKKRAAKSRVVHSQT